MSQKSDVDKVFFELMGYYPPKAGQAMEIISNAILSIITEKKAQHNKFIEGFSEVKHQIDGIIGSSTMLECKDYTVAKNKVGLGEVEQMEGALTDLPQFNEGYFASATPFTKDAMKYAEATEKNPLHKPIIPVEIRPSTPDDELNRIKVIHINLNAWLLNPQKSTISYIMSP